MSKKKFILENYIKIGRVNPGQLNPKAWANSIGLRLNDDNRIICSDDINALSKKIISTFHQIMLVSDSDFAIYNKQGYYEICASQKNKSGHLILARCIKGILNLHPEINLWSASLEFALITSMMRDIKVTATDFNTGPYISLDNGVYDLKKHVLCPASPDFQVTFKLPIIYDENASCPRFIQFMDEISGGDMELVQLWQEEVGYILSNETKAHKAFVWLSDGSSGKSTFANVIEGLIGVENISSVPLSDFQKNFSISTMYGKKLNLAGESDVYGKFNTSNFKLITANDPIQVERKRQQAFTSRLSLKLLFLMNNIPDAIMDNSYGFWRRLIVTPFPMTFDDQNRDLNLTRKLLDELPGILLWGIEGYKRLESQNFNFSKCNRADQCLKEMYLKNNPVLFYFKSYYEYALGKRILRSEIYKDYMTWAHAHNKPTTRKQAFWKIINDYFNQNNITLSVVKNQKGDFILMDYERIPL